MQSPSLCREFPALVRQKERPHPCSQGAQGHTRPGTSDQRESWTALFISSPSSPYLDQISRRTFCPMISLATQSARELGSYARLLTSGSATRKGALGCKSQQPGWTGNGEDRAQTQSCLTGEEYSASPSSRKQAETSSSSHVKCQASLKA